MLALPGSSYLYQGEELGLPDSTDMPDHHRQDPSWERSGRTERGRDGCRVPIPWATDGPSLGFGSSEPWLPQPKDWARWNVASEQTDPNSMLALYRRTLAVRRATPDLTSAGFELLHPDDPDLVVYRRGDVVVVLNMSDHERQLPADLVAGLRVLVSSVAEEADNDSVPPDAAVWLGR